MTVRWLKYVVPLSVCSITCTHLIGQITPNLVCVEVSTPMLDLLKQKIPTFSVRIFLYIYFTYAYAAVL